MPVQSPSRRFHMKAKNPHIVDQSIEMLDIRFRSETIPDYRNECLLLLQYFSIRAMGLYGKAELQFKSSAYYHLISTKGDAPS